jgi:hypothetical protein
VKSDYFQGRNALSATVITSPEQIAKLPWHGNHASDCGLFEAVDKYVHSLKDKKQQKRALYLMCLHGMGIDEPVSNAGLAEYLRID